MLMRLPYLLLLLSLSVMSVAASDAPAHPYVPNEVIVSFEERTTDYERARLLLDIGAVSVRHLGLINAEVVTLSSLTVDEALAVCRKSGSVARAEPNYIIAIADAPNDPLFPEQWSLNNTGSPGGVAGADICALDAWALAAGSRDVLVAVLDTGIDLDHPDLADNIFVNPGEVPSNHVDDDGNGFVDDVSGWDFRNDDAYPFDDHGHGTHCAGIIGAVGDNDLGTAGVAWEVSILPLKLMNQSGVGSNADAVDCIGYCVLMGADIMSASWCGGSYSWALEQALWEASSAGVLFVTAAGNSGQNADDFPIYPSCYESPNIISVAATDESDALASELDWSSNYGTTTVDIAAPGTRIMSSAVGGGHALMSGTSCAAPHVAGVLALMLADSPGATADELKLRLLSSAEPVPGLAGLIVSEGRLNAHAAIAGPDSVPPGRVTDLTAGEVGSTRTDLTWSAVGDDGTAGVATGYDIRYDLTEITEATFGAAPQVSEAPTPAPSGSLQMVRVSGLSPAATWYFAVKTFDEYGNVSQISNIASAVTLGPPAVSASPDSIAVSVLSGQTGGAPLGLANTGEGLLDWEASVEPPVSWLAPEPGAGAVAAGESCLVEVVFDASGTPPGIHRATLVFATNDPDQPVLEVPARLEVIGVPVIETGPALVDFGEVFVEYSSVESVFVWNRGTATLTVGAVDIAGEGFDSPGGPFALEPGESRKAGVTFAPETEGEHEGELRFESNDPTTPLVVVPLIGSAVPAPVVVASPDSIGAALLSGEFTTRSFQIENAGGSPLTWTTDREPAFGDSGGACELAGTVIARDRHHGEHPSGLWSVIIGDLIARGASVIEIDEPLTQAILGEIDVLWVTDCSEEWSEQETVALGEWVRDGGGLLLEGDETTSTVAYNAILRETRSGIVYSSTDGVPGTTTLVSSHVVTDGVRSVYFYSNSASIPVADPPSRSVVLDLGGTPAVVVSIPGRGRVAALADEAFHDGHIVDGDNRLLGNQIFDWLATGVDWLALDPVGGTLLAGEGRVVEVSLGRAGLLGGAYATELNMLTNDPSNPELLVSARLSVSGLPTIALSDTLLDFGEVAAWSAVSKTLTVTNDGTDSLKVLSVEARGDGFSASHVPFTLWVGETKDIEVGFSPESVGARSGTLFVRSDAVDQPEAAVHLVGTAVPPPDVLVAPVALEASVPLGLRDTLALSVGNVGVSDLVWTASTGEVQGTGPGRPRPDWVSVFPASGVTPPGTTDDLYVVLDATVAAEGLHEAIVIIESNDPDEGRLDVPLMLTVTATPDISISHTAFDFGGVMVGSSGERHLQVLNEGNSVLRVLDVTTDHEFFSGEPESLLLEPGEAQDLVVVFAPLEGGEVAALLTIHSDDHDEGSLEVELIGRGLVPPELAVAPTDFQIRLAEGSVELKALTMENHGDGPYMWDLDISTGHGQTGSQDLDGVVIMWDRSHGQPGIGTVGAFAEELQERGALVLENHSPFTPGLLAAYDVVWSGQVQQHWQESERGALAEWMGSGGALLLTSDTGLDVAVFNDLLAAVDEPFAFSVQPGFSGQTREVHGHCITRDVACVHLTSNSATLEALAPGAFRLVDDWTGRPNSAGSRFFEGRVVAVAEQLFENGSIDREDNRIFAHAVFDWLVFGAGWLVPGKWSGGLMPGAISDISLSVDATGLKYGSHPARLVLISRDLGESNIVIPFELCVVSGSIIELSESSLEFPDTDHGTTSVETLVIGNSGVAPLLIGSISTDHDCFLPSASTLGIPAQGEAAIRVSFFAESPGWYEAQLSIRSNDIDDPAVAVPLIARAIPAGLAEVSPDSLWAEVFQGGAATLELLIENVGSAELLWDIQAREATRRLAPRRHGCAEPSAADAGRGGGTDVGWISFDDGGGLLMAGEAAVVQLSLDATELDEGEYRADLVITTSDPRSLTMFVPVGLAIIPPTPADGVVCALFGNGVVTLDWWLPSVAGIDALNVYRSDDGDAYVLLNEQAIEPSCVGEFVDLDCWPGGVLWYDVRALLSDATEMSVGPGPVTVDVPSVAVTTLHPPSPNPFVVGTTLFFDTPNSGTRVVVSVCDISGRLVRTLYDDRPAAGRRFVEWNGRSEAGDAVASGVYLLRLEADGVTRTRKVIRLR